jgi:o-succinylbenzoate synthase
MTVARAVLYALRLPLREPLSNAHGEIRERRGFLLALEDGEGRRSFGEALPLPHFAGEAHAACERALRAALPRLVGPCEEAELEATLAGAPVARAACEIAGLTLAAAERGRPLAAELAAVGSKPAATVAVCALVAGDDPGAVARSARAALARGIEAFKLKVGALPLERDVERVAALRAEIGEGAELRLDANAAWSEAQAVDRLDALAPFAPRFVEQPVAGVAALARLRARTPIPVAADELVASSAAAQELVARGGADWLVLKLPPLGGPRRTLALARESERAGMPVVVSSFLDSSLGIRAALHVAAALGLEAACGVDTAGLLADDLVPGLALHAGRATPGEAAGLGVAPDPAALARLGRVVAEARA